MADTDYKDVRSLSRGLTLLQALNRAPGGTATTTSLSQSCNIHRTTVKRLLETLRADGYVRRGEKVGQGSLLGAVGSTGWATGPHLHFEFRINGEYQDPDLMAGEAGTVPLQNARERKEFAALSQDMRTQFASARDMQFASAE